MTARRVLLLLLLAAPTLLRAGLPTTVTVPLSIVDTAPSTRSTPEYCVGLNLKLGEGTYHLYEFDTGGTGFYAARTPADDWDFTPVGSGTLVMTYTSGNTFHARAVRTAITFEPGRSSSGAPFTLRTSDANLAMILTATNFRRDSDDPINHWTAAIAAGQPPLRHRFYGNFGANLKTRNGLFSILPQLPGNLNTGFIVDLGSYPGPARTARAIVQQGALQIGLTKSDRDRRHWATVIPMVKPTGVYPHTRQKLYTGALSDGLLTLTLASASRLELPVGIIYDTGTPAAVIYNHSGPLSATTAALLPFTVHGGTGPLRSGAEFTLRGSHGADILAFTTGADSGLNTARYSDIPNSVAPTNVNTGIAAFWGRRVMFDLADGFIGISEHN